MAPLKKRLIFLVPFVTLSLFTLRNLRPNISKQMELDITQIGGEDEGHLVNTPGCTIPKLDPYDKSIRHLISKGMSVKCDSRPPITFVDRTWLRLDRNISKVHYGEELSRCDYEIITRGGQEKTDNEVDYAKPVTFKEDILAPAEFVRVKCFGGSGAEIYVNYHAIIAQRSALEDRASTLFEAFKKNVKPKETLNLLMVGIDSMSQLNVIRQMPRTRDFLLNTLGAIEMLGYNKVADNTFVNLVPILSGKFLEELPWNETLASKPFDKYNLLWKEFSRQGYRTLFAEDDPTIATFNYLKSGFHKQPTDYYYRPFGLSMERDTTIWRNDKRCVASKLDTEIILDWVHDFVERFKSQPYFSFSFTGRLSHDDANAAGAADEPHFRFIKSLHDEALIENAVVIFFSDHGIRFGPMRQGYIGKIEERLPAMFLVFPKWFHQKYPSIISNLRQNARRLSSPFDLHETLKDIMMFDSDKILRRTSDQKRGISLFEEIPTTRTCTSAGILSHWCTCHSQRKADPNSAEVKKTAQYLVDHMNTEINKLSLSNLCEKISIHKIEYAQEIVAREDVLRYKQSLNDVIGRVVSFQNRTSSIIDYQMAVRTVPGDGLFEATVRYSEMSKAFTVIGGISRLNKYGDQSICINAQVVKKYCYCRK